MQTSTSDMPLPVLGWRDYTKTTGSAGVAASIAPGTITADTLTASGTTATFTATAAHRLVTGQSVTIAGATPGLYNGKHKIAVTSATAFTFVLTAVPSADASGDTITAEYAVEAQKAVISVPPDGTAVSIGANSQADLKTIDPGGEYALSMPTGAKCNLADFYAKSTPGGATYKVLYV